MVAGLEIWNWDGTTKLFELDPSGVSISEQKTVDPFDIPGTVWNPVFDNVSVSTKWTIRGTYRVSTQTYDTATYKGAYAFINELRSILKAVNPTGASAGAYVGAGSASKQDVLRLKFNDMSSGSLITYDMQAIMTKPDDVAGKKISFMYLSSSFEINAPLTSVNYTLEFQEVGGSTVDESCMRMGY